MRRFLTFAVGFAAFSFASVSIAANFQNQKSHSGNRAQKPAPTVIVPNHKAAYLVDQNKIRGRK